MKILIMGLSKSGTTGLYYQIFNSVKEPKQGIFERYDLEKRAALLDEDINLVTKLLLFSSPYTLQGHYDNVVEKNDKHILIVRDPRDNMISELLYIGGYHIAYNQTIAERKEKVRLLQKKETNPDNISVIQLFCFLMNKTESELLDYLKKRFYSNTEFLERYPNFHIIKYEDFVDSKFSMLEKYLEIPLIKESKPDEKHQHVLRTKKSGNWKYWFTKDDVEFLKPVFQNYLDRFDYAADWDLNTNPKIPPETSSKYFIKLIQKRRQLEGIETISEKISRKFFSN